MSRLHPVFNIIKLTPTLDDLVPGPLPPPLPEIIDGEEEWVVEEILDSRMINHRLCYLVKWEGFGIEHNFWESSDNVHSPDLISDFHQKHSRAPRQICFMDFNTIPFHSTLSPVVSGHHSLERGVDVRGHLQQPTIPMRPTRSDSSKAVYVPPHQQLPSSLDLVCWTCVPVPRLYL